MKNIIASLILFFTGFCLFGQNNDWQWLTTTGSNLNDTVNDIAVDISGNSYVVGGIRGSVTFGETTIGGANSDGFVGKLDNDGNWVWARLAGGNGSSIALDSNGNIYVKGTYNNQAFFGSITLTNSGNQDVYIAKLDSNGNYLWAIGSTAGSVYTNGIAVDSAGNPCITGYYSNSVTFGDSLLIAVGGPRAYVAKATLSGTWVWAVSSGAGPETKSHGIVTDSSSNIYITGAFLSNTVFGDYSLSTLDGRDLFVAMLNSSGQYLWALRGGSSVTHEVAYDITLDSNENILIAGTYFGPSAIAGVSLPALGWDDNIFVAKLDNEGGWLWVKGASSTASDQALAVCTDLDANVYITGYFQNTATFGGFQLETTGNTDVFVAKLDPDGNWQAVYKAGGTEADNSYSLAADNAGNIYVAGYLNWTVTFGNLTQTANWWDLFIAKFGQYPPLSPQNVIITVINNDIGLSWDAVTQDTDEHVIVTDAYYIYYNDSGNPDGQFILLGETENTHFMHLNITGSAEKIFYKITAVIQ